MSDFQNKTILEEPSRQYWLISNRVLLQPDSRLASRHRRGFREVLKRAA